ncbi:MAG: hypothetical protein ACKOX6_06055 [Bdellovibrio sp.]
MKIWIIIFIMIVSGSSFAAVPLRIEFPASHGVSLRVQVDSYVAALNKELGSNENNHEKFKVLSRVVDEITMLRDNGLPQSARDDAYMDLMVAVYESIPAEKDFKKRDCLRYENDLLNQFEPNADDAPTEPAVKPGWQALQSLCR